MLKKLTHEVKNVIMMIKRKREVIMKSHLKALLYEH